MARGVIETHRGARKRRNDEPAEMKWHEAAVAL